MSEHDGHVLTGAILIEGAYCGRNDRATVNRTLNRFRADYVTHAGPVKPQEWRTALTLIVHIDRHRRDCERLAAILRGDPNTPSPSGDGELLVNSFTRPARPRFGSRRFARV